MDVVGVVEAFLSFLSDYQFSKLELLGIIVLLSLVFLCPFWLNHRRKMTKIKYNFRLESTKLHAKIAKEEERRERKALRGKGK